MNKPFSWKVLLIIAGVCLILKLIISNGALNFLFEVIFLISLVSGIAGLIKHNSSKNKKEKQIQEIEKNTENKKGNIFLTKHLPILILIIGVGIFIFYSIYTNYVSQSKKSFTPGEMKEKFGATVDNWKSIRLGADKYSQDGIDFSNKVGTNYGHSIGIYQSYWGSLNLPPTQGNYESVELILNNNGIYQTPVSISGLKLEDADGRIYLPIASQYCGENIVSSYLPSTSSSILLKPSIPCSSIILFEVSAENKGFWLDFRYIINP